MYRHDYSLKNPSPITGSSRLYDANYYVMNQNFDVYICDKSFNSEEWFTRN